MLPEGRHGRGQMLRLLSLTEPWPLSCDLRFTDEETDLSRVNYLSIHPCACHVPGSAVGSGKWQSWDWNGLPPEPSVLFCGLWLPPAPTPAPPPKVRPVVHLVKLKFAATGHSQAQGPNHPMRSVPFLLKSAGINLKAFI